MILGLICWAPLRLSVRVTGDGRPGWVLEATWFRILRAGLDSGGRYFAVGKRRYRFSSPAAAPDAAPAESLQEKARALVQRWQSAAEEDGRIYFRLLKDGWQAIRFSIQGDCRLGFDDPALVAWMQGAFYASGLAERCPALDIKADYSQAGFWGIAEVGVEVRLMKLIIPAARFGKAKFGQFMKRRTRRGRNYGRCECDGIDRGVV